MTIGQISDKKLMKLNEQTRVEPTLHIEAILKSEKYRYSTRNTATG
jgi:hypothetical protein